MGHSIGGGLKREQAGGIMVVRLSDGGRLELGEGLSVVRLDRRGKIVEVVRPGDSCYGYSSGNRQPKKRGNWPG